MKRLLFILTAVAATSQAALTFAATPPATISGTAADWKPVPGHIMTRWAKDVTPEKVLPEYPRPQMVRSEWTNLNGLWDFVVTPKTAEHPAKYDGQILVPFCIESALSGVRKPLSDEQRLWYRRLISAPPLDGGKRLLLHFGAVDWEAKVFVNGKPVGDHRGGYDAFTCDITDAVKLGPGNELIVSVYDSSKGAQARGKQSYPRFDAPKGITYTPCSGIWQTVWLEVVPAARIESLKIVPDIDAGTVTVTVNTATMQFANAPAAATTGVAAGKAEVTVLDGDATVATGSGEAGQPIVLKLPAAKLWSPDSPFLYNLRIHFLTDEVRSYFGMRKIALGKDEKGVTRILFNNKFVFQSGFLDQGYWPDGIYTAPTDEALRYDIEMTKSLGMIVARKHVKVEPDRWYYWCDKLGLMVWQDMPSAGPRDGAVGHGAGRNGPNRTMVDGTAVTPEGGKQFESELKAMVEGRGNHPSIIMWIVFNEGWGQYDTPRLSKWVKELDPTRLVNNASGGHDIPAGDVMDAHLYPGPFAPKPTDGRAAVCGEFGGLALPITGHTWVDRTWGYRKLNSAADLTARYVGLIQRCYELKESEALNAYIYTQTTDVETECNGLMTYDRAVLKADLKTIHDVNRGIFAKPDK